MSGIRSKCCSQTNIIIKFPCKCTGWLSDLHFWFFSTFHREISDLGDEGQPVFGTPASKSWPRENGNCITSMLHGKPPTPSRMTWKPCRFSHSKATNSYSSQLRWPFSLETWWHHPHSTTEHGRACSNVAHIKGASGASSRLMPGLL